MLTNLANTLDNIGRFVAAVAMYERAIDADSSFGMPRANLGISLKHYAECHYDPGHQAVLLWHAHKQIKTAKDLPLEPGVKDKLCTVLNQIRSFANTTFLDRPLQREEYPLGKTDEEIVYRRWCLAHRLFLNDLNDCTEATVAAIDVLHLPDVVLPVGVGPGLHGFYNQLKQEYASARYLLFESMQNDVTHFSDRDVKLVNTLDYPCYGLAVEKTRLAFRMACSILDKVAVFMGQYLGLENADRVSFPKRLVQKRTAQERASAGV